MANLLEKAIRLTAKGFDIERKKLFPPGLWLALLSRDGRTQVFHEIAYFESGFIPRSNNFRTGFYIEIATAADLSETILKTSFFSLSGKCYAVGEGDVFEPSGDRFSWMIYGTFVRDTYLRTV